MKPFLVGMDSYCLNPLRLSPLEVLDWARAHHCDGVQFSELFCKEEKKSDPVFLTELASAARDRNLFLEWGGGQHIPFDMLSWKPKDLMPVNRAAAEQAAALGAPIIRSCSGGLMRWNDAAPPTEALLHAMARELGRMKPMLEDLGVTLAIELHFEFTTFELLRVFDLCNAEPGGCFGICLDTMNMLTLLEDPVCGAARMLPWIAATHIKDGGLCFSDQGLVSFTAEVGRGSIDFTKILRLLSTLESPVTLCVEDHGGSFDLPVFDPVFLSRFPDLTAAELSRLFSMAHQGDLSIRKGEMSPLDRAAWPKLCETRTASGIQYLRRLVNPEARSKNEG
ncbi:MAG: TIM barrel protein [Planctomycetota bacterium]